MIVNPTVSNSAPSSEINSDFICNTGKLDTTLFPVGSNFRSFNTLAFLCDLLKNANDESISPILVPPPPEFDITPYTDFSGLTGIGDTRASLGDTLSATFVNFLPRMIVQTEIKQNGGSQIVNNYICNADGVPIKESSTIPAILSIDLTGQKPYNYGAIYVPPISATVEELTRPIDPQEVRDFVNKYIYNNRVKHAEDFVKFLNLNFDENWTITLNQYKIPPAFMVKLNNIVNNQTVYLKYYDDMIEKVACLLYIKTLTYNMGITHADSTAEIAAFTDPVLDYNAAINNSDEMMTLRETIKQKYTTTPDLLFSKMYDYGVDPTTLFTHITSTQTLYSTATGISSVGC
jgi:hypothetical protein